MRLSSVLLLALLASVVNNWRRRLHDHYPPTAKKHACKPKLNDNVLESGSGGRAGSVIAGGIPLGALAATELAGAIVALLSR